MAFAEWKWRGNRRLMILVACIVISAVIRSAPLAAQDTSPHIGRVRSVTSDGTGLPHPAGLAYSPRAGSFHVLAAWAAGRAPGHETDLVRLTPFGQPAGSARIAAAIRDPMNVAFDPWRNRLLILQSPASLLLEVREGPEGDLDPATLARHNVRPWGLQAPSGLAVDPASGHLFILDVDGPRLLRVAPAPDGSFDAALVSAVDLQPTGLGEVRGLAFDPTTGHLHTLGLPQQRLYELTPAGEVVAVRDLGGAGIGDLLGMVFAPSGDLTDDPATVSLYVADSGIAGDLQAQPGAASLGSDADLGAGTSFGGILEFSLAETPAPAATTDTATLIQAIETSRWSPPSPDPCGITYLPASNTLLVSDSEVNEMPIFTGVNLYQATLTGALVATSSTIPFSDEPTGIDRNPTNGHLFVTDDTGARGVYEWSPGPDGLFATPDDVVTFFRTSDSGSRDPEDVTYATEGPGVLYIVDGVNREVYRVDPGANGVFDGVPPAGDDLVSQFDTLSHGLDEPQGIVFVPGSGHLYAIGKPGNVLFEFTTGGALVRTIDLSAANPRKPAGLALAPSSQDPATTNLYIVARGVDNGTDPEENDGMLYEVTFGSVAPPIPTVTPMPTATPTIVPTPVTGDITDSPPCHLPLVIRAGGGDGVKRD